MFVNKRLEVTELGDSVDDFGELISSHAAVVQEKAVDNAIVEEFTGCDKSFDVSVTYKVILKA